MAAGFEIAVTGNANGFVRSTKDVEKALESVDDSLDDLARATAKSADKAGDELSDGFKDAQKDVERELDEIEDNFRDLVRASKKAGNDVGDDLKKGFERAGDGAREFADEANSTAKEAAASFDGSAESIGDAMQEVAANAFSGFGPAGTVAGLAAAAGLGLVMTEWNKNAEEMEARTTRMYDAMMDENVAYVSEAVIQNNVLNASEAEKAEARTIAAKAGVSEEVGRRAIAGDTVAQNEIIIGLQERITRAREAELDAARNGQNEVAKGFAQEQRDIEATIGKVQSMSGAWGQAAQDAAVTQKAVQNVGLSAQDAEAKARAAAQGIGAMPKDFTMRGNVDMSAVDSGIRNYRPPKVNIPGRIVDRYGREIT